MIRVLVFTPCVHKTNATVFIRNYKNYTSNATIRIAKTKFFKKSNRTNVFVIS